MTDPWDRFAANAADHLQMLGFDTDNVDVYEPNISPVAGEGFSTSYPDAASASVTAGIEPVTASSSRDESGTDTDADVVLYVPTDASPQWVGYGESGVGDVDAAAIVELPDGFRALVTDYEPQQDGLDRLEVTETSR